ncbi:peptidylprolyl isomerase [Neisseria dentiae]|uniref:peptidylprolyl isomerase n=1 Tax=Neisseria dentiae TaxID=194197 RepID=UPI0035A12841
MKKLSTPIFTGLALAAAFSAQAETRAVIDTNMGKIELALDEKKAPKTVANFSNYANKGFYNGTIFHRVIDGFMIQGGGFTPDMTQKATEKAIANEADNGLKNTVGTIAMARTANPNSATSQFFINVADNDFLNFKSKTTQGYGYAVFGKVVSGMDVVNKIAKVKTTDQAYHQNIPVQPVVIRNVTIVK